MSGLLFPGSGPSDPTVGLAMTGVTDPAKAVDDVVDAADAAVEDPLGTLWDLAEEHNPVTPVFEAADGVVGAIHDLFGGDGASAEDRTTDTDGDGVTDWQERHELGTDPLRSDTDGDGVGDGAEVDRATDPLDADSDSDGLADGAELARGTDPLSWDSDGDGWSDGLEVRYVATDPLRQDTDGDGLSDRDEGMLHRSDPLSRDSDADGRSDGAEVAAGTDPNDFTLGRPEEAHAATDRPGATDGAIGTFTHALPTSLTSVDVTDVPITTGATPLVGDDTSIIVVGGRPDVPNADVPQQVLRLDVPSFPGSTPDADGDGACDVEERWRGTDPYDADSDDDGLSDGIELSDGPDLGSDVADRTNALDADSDDDGVPDGTEYQLDHDTWLAPPAAELDASGGLTAFAEPAPAGAVPVGEAVLEPTALFDPLRGVDPYAPPHDAPVTYERPREGHQLDPPASPVPSVELTRPPEPEVLPASSGGLLGGEPSELPIPDLSAPQPSPVSPATPVGEAVVDVSAQSAAAEAPVLPPNPIAEVHEADPVLDPVGAWDSPEPPAPLVPYDDGDEVADLADAAPAFDAGRLDLDLGD